MQQKFLADLEDSSESFYVGEEGTFSYKQTIQRTYNIAKKLPGTFVSPKDIDTYDSICLLFASLVRGKIFTPLNPKAPQEVVSRFKNKLNPFEVDNGWIQSNVHESSLPQNFEIFDPQKPAVCIMTSGTTGSPKAAVLSFANLMESAKTTNEFYNVCTGDSWQLNLPIHHIAGLMIPIRMLIACGKVHAKQSSYSDFHSLVPTQLYRALREDKWKQYRESKAVIVGGAHLPDSLYQKALKLGLPISKTYGSTESCSGISATKPGLISKSHSTGKKFAHLDVKISDGLLKFRGQSLFLGYVQDDKSISKEVDPEGYFSTNDLAKIDKDGEIFIQGRKDEIFISGGENVDPQVINDLCLQHIPDCIPIVIPVSDEEMGQRAHLIFWGITVPDRELLEFLFDSLKTPWRPKMCTFCSMNQAPLGKITRKQTELFLKDGGGIKVF